MTSDIISGLMGAAAMLLLVLAAYGLLARQQDKHGEMPCPCVIHGCTRTGMVPARAEGKETTMGLFSSSAAGQRELKEFAERQQQAKQAAKRDEQRAAKNAELKPIGKRK